MLPKVKAETKQTNVGSWLFPALLLATVFQNYYDLVAVFAGDELALFAYEGPVLYKIGKDVLYVAMVVAILGHARKLRSSPFSDYSVTVFYALAVLFLISLLSNGLLIASLGLRWALPLVLFFLLRDWAGSLNARAATLWIFVGIVVCAGAQVYQLLNMPPVFGEIAPGLSARTPGIFAVPNSAAFFACASAACVIVFNPSRTLLQTSGALLALFISAMAQSGTGLVASAILLLRTVTGRSPLIFWTLTLFALLLILPNLDQLTLRDDYTELSGGRRLDVLWDIARQNILSLDTFGVFTNVANLLSENPAHRVAADSLWASWIGNLGVMSVPIAGLCLLFASSRMKEIDWERAVPALVVFALFSLTTIVFEAFPMNIYLAIALWSARRSVSARSRFYYPSNATFTVRRYTDAQ